MWLSIVTDFFFYLLLPFQFSAASTIGAEVTKEIMLGKDIQPHAVIY